ncbi:MAG: alpha/beta hydrolase [Ktedonobacteraceae bacterium]|nr:alpha/beta hydrolase [Chloroflexota bacterium]
MLTPTSESQPATRDQERRVARVIHYNISYSVDGAEHGTDGAIVLLHDIVGGAFAWRNVIPQLAGANRAIYAIDMLGYGLSDHPWPADTSIWGHADYLAMLFDQLNLTNIVLVGHGLGGGVAQVLATRLSVARVAALVLIDTTCYLHSFAENWPLPNMKERQDPDAPKHVKAEDVVQEMRATLPNAAHNSDQFKKALDDYVTPWDSEVGKELLYQQIRLLIPSYSNAVASDLKTMGKPTLIIWGQNDQQVPLKYAQRLHRDIPQSRLVIIPDAAHLTLFDAPDAVASAITEFVSSV